MENKLIPMTTFVLEQSKSPIHRIDVAFNCIKYAKFLSQPLTLGMFVPVDEKGKPYDMQEVEVWKNHSQYSTHYRQELEFFEQACERVLFEGLKVKTYANGWEYISCGSFTYLISSGNKLFDDNQDCAPRETKDTIEELLQCGTYLTLTATAIKSIYGS
ncbi:hypothetical protein [Elizabethkingia anophelis]|uniref:hypothetical protein n=1 Tax=Elizabethkingia anophelis TaxID=1117645 RepID=UPI000DD69498|nr:hypothetical protein [Elizabethkingia anophelis]RBA36146.1 hypothetical protein DSC50_02020 [Elizabethkingia anophelis]